MSKFKGKYRLKAPIDESIGEFARDDTGKYIEHDVYIDCGRNGKIYHIGGSTMEAWIGDIEKGTSKTGTYKNILKPMGVRFDKDCWPMYSKDSPVSNVIVGDGECSFQFNVKHVDYFAKEMKSKTSGKNISPFSKKNLPKEKYDIPENEIAQMKAVTSGLQVQQIMKAYREFGKQNNVEPNKIAIHKAGLWSALVGFIGEIDRNTK